MDEKSKETHNERDQSLGTRKDTDESADTPGVGPKLLNIKSTESAPIGIKSNNNNSGGGGGSGGGVGSSSGGISEVMPMDQILKTANTMTNMLMAHKIALDDDFRLEPGMDISGPLMSLSPILGSSSPLAGERFKKGEPSLQNKNSTKEIMHDAYWDLLRENLKSGQSSETKDDCKYDIFKQLLSDIKQKIIDLLLPQHSSLKQEIEDKLDLKIVDQLGSVGSLDLLDYARYILGILRKLCAPVRDEKLDELNEITDIVLVYRGIMELLESMRLDFANFTLNSFKPHIKAHSQDYEREKFNEILIQQRKIGIDGLEFTKVWLKRAVQHVEEQHGLTDMLNEIDVLDGGHDGGTSSTTIMTFNAGEASSSSSNDKRDKILRTDAVNKILNKAYCELLEWLPEKQRLYPETLLFDEATFKQLGEQYKVLMLASSILLTTFAFVGKFNLQANQEFRTLVKSHIITLLTASYDNQTTQTTDNSRAASSIGGLDQAKLETVASRLIEDIRQKLNSDDRSSLDTFENQAELFKRQILDIQSESNRIRQLARRRILEFVDTILTLDVKQQQKKFPSNMPPPVNIPLGLNCLADEITLTMTQMVKIIRYNRRVFFQHYHDIIVEFILEITNT